MPPHPLVVRDLVFFPQYWRGLWALFRLHPTYGSEVPDAWTLVVVAVHPDSGFGAAFIRRRDLQAMLSTGECRCLNQHFDLHVEI